MQLNDKRTKLEDFKKFILEYINGNVQKGYNSIPAATDNEEEVLRYIYDIYTKKNSKLMKLHETKQFTIPF